MVDNALDCLVKLIDESGMRLLFWVCPAGCNGRVTWETVDGADVATCQVCGRHNAAIAKARQPLNNPE